MIGTICFALAVIHTFASNAFNTLARRFPEGSTRKNLFHFLGEVEVVFGLWAGVFIVFYIFTKGFAQGLSYLESIDFTEPAFVFVIMCIAGTRPIVSFAERGDFMGGPSATLFKKNVFLHLFFDPGPPPRFLYHRACGHDGDGSDPLEILLSGGRGQG